jgi:chromate transporter
MAQPPASGDAPVPVQPGLGEIFVAFTGMAIVGFGGVLPWARRMLVERRGWLTADEFTEVLSLGQFLPGGNIVNVSIVVGQRFHGVAGSIAAAAGLLLAPTLIVLLFGSLYLAYGQTPTVHHALSGVTAAAAGLILSMAAKMAAPLLRRDSGVRLGFAAITFAAIGLLGFSLPLVLVVLAPLSILISWWQLK